MLRARHAVPLQNNISDSRVSTLGNDIDRLATRQSKQMDCRIWCGHGTPCPYETRFWMLRTAPATTIEVAHYPAATLIQMWGGSVK